MRPICVPCQRFLRPIKNNFCFVEGMAVAASVDDGKAWTSWAPYKLWAGDLYECEGCKAQIISGVASHPIRECYMPDFNQVCEQLGADLQVNE